MEGGTIELVHGPQGGYHVLGSCHMFGLDPDGRIIHYVARTPEGVVLAESSLALMARALTPFEGGYERLGDRVIFDILSPSEVVGQTIVLSVTLEALGTSDTGASPSDGGVARTELASAHYTLTIVDAIP